YLLITSPSNHGTFESFEEQGILRVPLADIGHRHRRWNFDLQRLLSRLPGWARFGGPLAERGVNLLFCPMTDPILAEAGIPVVNIVYDLQHLAYPSFFTAEERAHRDAFFARVKH